MATIGPAQILDRVEVRGPRPSRRPRPTARPGPSRGASRRPPESIGPDRARRPHVHGAGAARRRATGSGDRRASVPGTEGRLRSARSLRPPRRRPRPRASSSIASRQSGAGSGAIASATIRAARMYRPRVQMHPVVGQGRLGGRRPPRRHPSAVQVDQAQAATAGHVGDRLRSSAESPRCGRTGRAGGAEILVGDRRDQDRPRARPARASRASDPSPPRTPAVRARRRTTRPSRRRRPRPSASAPGPGPPDDRTPRRPSRTRRGRGRRRCRRSSRGCGTDDRPCRASWPSGSPRSAVVVVASRRRIAQEDHPVAVGQGPRPPADGPGGQGAGPDGQRSRRGPSGLRRHDQLGPAWLAGRRRHSTGPAGGVALRPPRRFRGRSRPGYNGDMSHGETGGIRIRDGRRPAARGPPVSDTSPEAQRVLDAVYRAMSPERKWRLDRGRLPARSAAPRCGPAPAAAGRDSRRDARDDWLGQCSVRGHRGGPWRNWKAWTSPQTSWPSSGRGDRRPRRLGDRLRPGRLDRQLLHGVGRYTRDADLSVEPFPGRRRATSSAAFGDDYYVSPDAVRRAVRERSQLQPDPHADRLQGRLLRPPRPRVRRDRRMARDGPACRSPGDGDRRGPSWSAPRTSSSTSSNGIAWAAGRRTGSGPTCSGVLRVQAGRLDEAYLDRWAAELGVADLLAEARAEAADERAGLSRSPGRRLLIGNGRCRAMAAANTAREPYLRSATPTWPARVPLAARGLLATRAARRRARPLLTTTTTARRSTWPRHAIGSSSCSSARPTSTSPTSGTCSPSSSCVPIVGLAAVADSLVRLGVPGLHAQAEPPGVAPDGRLVAIGTTVVVGVGKVGYQVDPRAARPARGGRGRRAAGRRVAAGRRGDRPAACPSIRGDGRTAKTLDQAGMRRGRGGSSWPPATTWPTSTPP